MSEDFRPVYMPEPFTPPRDAACATLDPGERQTRIQRHLQALTELVGGAPGREVNLTDEFLARLADGGPRLAIISDPQRMLTRLVVSGGMLVGEVINDQ